MDASGHGNRMLLLKRYAGFRAEETSRTKITFFRLEVIKLDKGGKSMRVAGMAQGKQLKIQPGREKKRQSGLKILVVIFERRYFVLATAIRLPLTTIPGDLSLFVCERSPRTP